MPQRKDTAKGHLAIPGTTGPVPQLWDPPSTICADPGLGPAPTTPWPLVCWQCSCLGSALLPPTQGCPRGHHQPHAGHAPSHNTTSEHHMSHKTMGVDVTRTGQTRGSARSGSPPGPHYQRAVHPPPPRPILAPPLHTAASRREGLGAARPQGHTEKARPEAVPGQRLAGVGQGCAHSWSCQSRRCKPHP